MQFIKKIQKCKRKTKINNYQNEPNNCIVSNGQLFCALARWFARPINVQSEQLVQKSFKRNFQKKEESETAPVTQTKMKIDARGDVDRKADRKHDCVCNVYYRRLR